MGILSRKEKIKAKDLGKVLLAFIDVFNNFKNYENIKSTIEKIQEESSLNIDQKRKKGTVLFFLNLRIKRILFATADNMLK